MIRQVRRTAKIASPLMAMAYARLVLVRLGHVLLIAALLVATGGHWAVLQTVAWTNMLAENLQTGSWSEALTRTFDGKHPCTMCKQISAGKKSEKKAEFPSPAAKLEFVSERPTLAFAAPTDFHLLTVLTVPLTSWTEAPPTPPPLAV